MVDSNICVNHVGIGWSIVRSTVLSEYAVDCMVDCMVDKIICVSSSGIGWSRVLSALPEVAFDGRLHSQYCLCKQYWYWMVVDMVDILSA